MTAPATGSALSRATSTTAPALTADDLRRMMDRHGYSDQTRHIIATENLLPLGLLARLQATYPSYSGLLERSPFLFTERDAYAGLDGFRRVIAALERQGIHIGHMTERELFVEVYRFKASRHALNSINWDDYERDSMFQLMFPQPGMIRQGLVDAYAAANSPEQRTRIAQDYARKTNPHDGHQLLNKPWLECDGEDGGGGGGGGGGGIDLVEGSQHKYPQCMLVFDKTTQKCFAFCTYCFRHAQVRGDDDMFIQEDIVQIHDYLRAHPEVTDLLITGGDAGYIPVERLRQYVMPIIQDPRLLHVRTVRLGSRMLTYQPELILTRKYDRMLALFDTMHDNGVQLSWMSHFSTPRELLNPSTIAAIRRLQRHGVVVRSQSPIMNHISLFTDEQGRVDVQRSAQNWIDLGNLLATLLVRFHSMYCARATGEHHYFTAPLADIEKISNLVFRSLSSLNRPSRYITMTTSAGKLSILGTAEVNGQTAFALKFNESRNMAWMDRVFLAKYDRSESRVDFLLPFDTDRFFFEDELKAVEQELLALHGKYRPADGAEAGRT